MFLASMSDQAGGFDDCQVELGRYQFLEDKEERKKRVRHLVGECHDQAQQKQGIYIIAFPVFLHLRFVDKLGPYSNFL